MAITPTVGQIRIIVRLVAILVINSQSPANRRRQQQPVNAAWLHNTLQSRAMVLLHYYTPSDNTVSVRSAVAFITTAVISRRHTGHSQKSYNMNHAVITLKNALVG